MLDAPSYPPAYVEERLIEALETDRALPDRERGVQRALCMGLWREAVPEWGDYIEATPGRPGVSVRSHDRMAEAFGWCTRWLTPEDVRLVARVIAAKRAGKTRIWTMVRRQLGVKTTTAVLEARYDTCLCIIGTALSAERGEGF